MRTAPTVVKDLSHISHLYCCERGVAAPRPDLVGTSGLGGEGTTTGGGAGTPGAAAGAATSVAGGTGVVT